MMMMMMMKMTWNKALFVHVYCYVDDHRPTLQNVFVERNGSFTKPKDSKDTQQKK